MDVLSVILTWVRAKPPGFMRSSTLCMSISWAARTAASRTKSVRDQPRNPPSDR
jgi:hypothetical protein